MHKQNASVFFRKQMNGEVPQKILTFFRSISRITQGEEPVAIFGSVNEAKGVENSAVLLEDRLEYLEWSHLLPKNKTILISFIDQIYLLPESGYSFIAIIDKMKNSVRLNIKAPGAESTAFYNLIKEYRQKNREGKHDVKVTIKCPNCGASCNGYKGEEIECEYCGSALIG